MGLHFKGGVDMREMTPQILFAWIVASEVYESVGEVCMATSLYRQGTWDQVLLHGKGAAIDLAIRKPDGTPFEVGTVDAIVQQLTHRLGKKYGGQYDVVDERGAGSSAGWTGAHIHIEFDPKA